MAGQADKTKGRAKEVAGDVTGNDELKSKGKADRQAGEAKEKLGALEAKGEHMIDKVKNVLHPNK